MSFAHLLVWCRGVADDGLQSPEAKSLIRPSARFSRWRRDFAIGPGAGLLQETFLKVIYTMPYPWLVLTSQEKLKRGDLKITCT